MTHPSFRGLLVNAVAGAWGTETGRELQQAGDYHEETQWAVDVKGTSIDQIRGVFDHWKNTMVHPQAHLDLKRRGLIRKALQLGYTTNQLCDAISGCAVTPHNIGMNDRGQRYDGLHVILRDADQIDRFIHNHLQPPKVLNAAQQKAQSNAATLQNWLNTKAGQLGVCP